MSLQPKTWFALDASQWTIRSVANNNCCSFENIKMHLYPVHLVILIFINQNQQQMGLFVSALYTRTADFDAQCQSSREKPCACVCVSAQLAKNVVSLTTDYTISFLTLEAASAFVHLDTAPSNATDWLHASLPPKLINQWINWPTVQQSCRHCPRQCQPALAKACQEEHAHNCWEKGKHFHWAVY